MGTVSEDAAEEEILQMGSRCSAEEEILQVPKEVDSGVSGGIQGFGQTPDSGHPGELLD